MISIPPCGKGYSLDQDKACSPEETVAHVQEKLKACGQDILTEIKRIDTGRLGIPVYMSVAGQDARTVMPTRKQMGKGASVAQARASALMELVERYSFFNFFEKEKNFVYATWSEAVKRFGDDLIPVSQLIKATGDTITEDEASSLMDCFSWRFVPVTDITHKKPVYAPIDFFKYLNEFNGSSAGNAVAESLLQGACELIERHVCAVCDRSGMTLPTIDPASLAPVAGSDNTTAQDLLQAFTRAGIKVWLKDLTQDFCVPTIGALAYDPATFPDSSEIVYTAGTACSPHKAVIRALTEVAQLAGDFETGAQYEASGLPKYLNTEDCAPLQQGPAVNLSELPCIADNTLHKELEQLCQGLSAQGYTLYSVDITHEGLGIPAHYSFVPGFLFRERTARASMGLFVGRILAEQASPEQARAGLAVMERIYSEESQRHFLPFFHALVCLKSGDTQGAAQLFAVAEPLQDDPEDKALAAFYQAYALTQSGEFTPAIPHLDRAIQAAPDVKEYFNLRGVAYFKQQNYATAAADFTAAIDLDSGSAMDLANLGVCYKHMGQAHKALHCLSQALELDNSIDFARQHLEEILQDETTTH